MIRVLAADRQSGKTTATIQWLLEGEKVPSYPGWSRVLLVATMTEFNRLRKLYWESIEDFDHRVYHHRDWATAYRVHPNTEVVVDNIEMILPRLPGRLAGFTVTGQSWS